MLFKYCFLFLEPRVYFDRVIYEVDENADICQVTVKRTGSDLSKHASVVVRSKKTSPPAAKGTGQVYS